jgi:RimJ/RimL family protein N-acetyltransferase
MPSLRTERLVLRRVAEGDLAALALVSDHAPRDLADALEHWARHGFGPWLIEAGDVPVGVFEVNFAGAGIGGIAPEEVEVGWALVDGFRGCGYATEAGRAAVADAFARSGAPWLVAYIRPENEASHRVAARLGMRRDGEGTTRGGDRMVIYRLRRNEA